MNHRFNRARVLATKVLACITLGMGSLAVAAEFPTRPVTIVSPWPAGTAADLSARILAERLAPMLKQPVIVDNRPGASQLVAFSYVARAPADGHTLLLAAMPAVFPQSILAKAPFKSLRDFTPVANVLNLSALLAVSSDIPVNNLQEFIGHARKNAALMSYGSAGIGSPLHLVDELFNKQAGVSVLHVPYKGGAQITQELIAHRISYGFVMIDSAQYAGRVKILGLADTQRNPHYPDIPTLHEQGLKGFKAGLRHVMVAPAGMPADRVDLLNKAIREITGSSSFAERVKVIGVPAEPLSPSKVGESIGADEAGWNDLVKSANIVLE